MDTKKNIFKSNLSPEDVATLNLIHDRLHVLGTESRPYHGPHPNMSARRHSHDVNVHRFHEAVKMGAEDFATLQKLIVKHKLYIGPLEYDTSIYAFDVDPNKAFGIYETGKSYPVHTMTLMPTLTDEVKKMLGAQECEDILFDVQVTKKKDFIPKQRLVLAFCDLQCSAAAFRWFVKQARSSENASLVFDTKAHKAFLDNLAKNRKGKLKLPQFNGPKIMAEIEKGKGNRK